MANEPDVLKVRGKKALVVGGGLGMGRATCELLGALGVDVAVLDLLPERAETIAAKVKDAGGNAIALAADALNYDAAERAVAEACERFGRLDMLVNIIGQAAFVPTIDMPHEVFDSEIQRNLRYVFTTARAFARLPYPGGDWRTIVSIASISGMNSAPNHAAYGASKAGLMSLTRTMAQEWGALHIRVNCIAPGSIWTDRTQGTPERDALTAPIIPLGRKGHQDEIAKAVLFLSSDLSSYVSGHTLLVDGGVQTNYPFPIGR